MEAFNDELKRTAVQRKVVSKLPASAVLSHAAQFFESRGYRTGATGRGSQMYIMGAKEGILPRVTGDVTARADVGKPGTTLVTVNAAGERLGPAMTEFILELRQARKAGAAASGEQRRSQGADTSEVSPEPPPPDSQP